MGDMPIQIWADVQEDAGVDTLLLRAWQMSDPGYGRQGHMLCITDGDIVIAPVLYGNGTTNTSYGNGIVSGYAGDSWVTNYYPNLCFGCGDRLFNGDR